MCFGTFSHLARSLATIYIFARVCSFGTSVPFYVTGNFLLHKKGVKSIIRIFLRVDRTPLSFLFRYLYCHVTIQYLHSYVQKSIPDQLRWWDFCLPAYVFLRSAQQVRRPTEQLRWKYLFRCYKELSLLRKNGKMNINKGKIWKQPWYRRKVPFLYRKLAVNAFSCL